MRVLTIIPMHTSTRHLEEDTRGFCFLFCSERCLALIPLPLPFSPLPFGMDFGSATRAGGSLSPPGGEAFGGTALTAGAPATFGFGFESFESLGIFLGLLKDCSIDLALASSLSSTRNSCNRDHKKSKSRRGPGNWRVLYGALLEQIFLFPAWDMLVTWRATLTSWTPCLGKSWVKIYQNYLLKCLLQDVSFRWFSPVELSRTVFEKNSLCFQYKTIPG